MQTIVLAMICEEPLNRGATAAPMSAKTVADAQNKLERKESEVNIVACPRVPGVPGFRGLGLGCEAIENRLVEGGGEICPRSVPLGAIAINSPD